MTLWLLLGCGGEPSEAPRVAPPPDHFGEWARLERAVAHGDVPTAQVIARDLSMGDVQAANAASVRVGAAVGFLQVAEDPEELALGLDRAAAGCGPCHESLTPPPIPTATHATALARAAWGAVWARPADLPAAADVPSEIRVAWDSGHRVEAVAAACQRCHAGGGSAAEPVLQDPHDVLAPRPEGASE